MDAKPLAYLIKGDDPTLVNQELSVLMEKLSADAGGALAIEDLGPEALVSSAVDSCQTPSLLNDMRIVILANVGRFKALDVEPLVEYLANPMASALLVMTSGGGAIPTKLTKAIKQHGHVIDAATPFGKAKQGWVAQKCRASEVRLDGGAIAMLAEHMGEELGQLEGVLDALTAAYGVGASVSATQLAPFLGPGGGAAPWELTDAIDSGDVATALAQLQRMLGPGGRHPLVVMSSLTKHFGNLHRLDGAPVSPEADAAQLLGVAPFPAKKAMAQSAKLGSAKVSRALSLVAQADVDLRGASAWPPNVVLEVLVARLARLRPPGKASARPSAPRR